MLSDYEVLKHLDEIRESRDSSVRTLKAENVETIILEVHAYLRDRPAGNPANPQSAEKLTEFVRLVKPYELEKAEILQLINVAPRSLPVLFNAIEECDQRFTDEQMEELLELIAQYVGFEPTPEVEEGEAEETA